MRADRLVAILMLLQTRGQVTAAEVAEELEISERTARRDLDALGVAGLPIYSVQGRGGGWRLLGGGRTDLSGLTAAEARALFLVAGPASASPEVKAALRKLVRALPEPFRESAEAATAAVVVDPSSWDRRPAERPVPPYLDLIQQAVVDGVQLDLGYVARDRSGSRRVVHPLGLAAKGQIWYLVADTFAGLRTFRVDRVAWAAMTGEPVVRPNGFNLPDAWRMITEKVDQMRTPVRAQAAADPSILPTCRYVFGTRLGIGPSRPDGRIDVELRGHGVWPLGGEIAGFGAGLEVLEPPELRDHLARVGGELSAIYGAPRRPRAR
jgi:predicted DNA-binding transcriptional regulator YafY